MRGRDNLQERNGSDYNLYESFNLKPAGEQPV